MKYWENDILSGISESCYLDPAYHPACLGCVDRMDCYGEVLYADFRVKALIMSELLDHSDCLNPMNADRLAEALGVEWEEEKVRKILLSNYCTDGRIKRVVKLALESERHSPQPRIRELVRV
ncbi:MAG TPA: hypothetical protein VN426_12020 [Syntrophomonadaceae bacterium]|nr:hypothetical protein [Syntrophomonadaceae bacterium]